METFDGPDPSWRVDSAGTTSRVLVHQRAPHGGSDGSGCEHLKVVSGPGSFLYLGHPIGQAAVIDELAVRLSVRSNRPGIQLLAQVVLPRTTDPRTGGLFRVLIPGTTYSTPGRWQWLLLEKLPAQLLRKLPAWRAEFGSHVDLRGAFVERVVLNVSTGPGETSLWIDRLEVTGYAQSPRAHSGPGLAGPAQRLPSTNGNTVGPMPTETGGVVATGGWQAVRAADSATGTPTGEAAADPATLPAVEAPATMPWQSPNAIFGSAVQSGPGAVASWPSHRVQLVGSVLSLDGQVIFPRILEHRGEPLELVKQLGFNVVWLPGPPDSAVLGEAERLDLWLVCPPPLVWLPAGSGGLPQEPQIEIGPQHGRVMAWDLGSELHEEQLPELRRRAEAVRIACEQAQLGNRLLVCRPETGLRWYGRVADVLVLGRAPAGSSLTMRDTVAWIAQQSSLARPGTPIWSTVQTQYASELIEQIGALGGTNVSESLPPGQLRLLVSLALVSGSRGLVFQSSRRLDQPDQAAEMRRLALELINRELSLVDPWLSAGTFVTDLPSGAEELYGGVFRTDRARLVLAHWLAAGSQMAPAGAAPGDLRFIVPGVPESYNAYWLFPGAVRPLRHERVTSGVRVDLDAPQLSTAVVLTQDPLVLNAITQKASEVAPRAAWLAVRLASIRLDQVRSLQAGLGTAAPQQAQALFSAAGRAAGEAAAALEQRNWSDAYLAAMRAMIHLRQLERDEWQGAMAALPGVATSPAAMLPGALPWHWQLKRLAESGTFGPNLLIGGGFDDFAEMAQSGWRHYQRTPEGVRAQAELSPSAARSGRYGLRLVSAAATERAPAAVESPPVWITSAPVSVEAGQLVAIRGWVRVVRPIQGGADGLMVIDSVGRLPLAERFVTAGGWQPLAMYRVATQSGPLHLTFALWGYGEVFLDDFQVQILDTSSQRVVGAPATLPTRARL